MTDLFKGVTVRSVLETLFFGKPGATAEERRNYLYWGHPAPRAEHKVILLLAMALVALSVALIAFEADAAPRSHSHNAEPVSRIVVLAPLA
ncbi:hypothetical protein [Novosphingobium resinovorum]|uniref:hypothetical protein n=1 Tax=Novosphingobium resinovorum TaxID=158500 RepID=UPI002ED6211C|nr:hypothetical protein [Novosphingobium resinovorum]